MNRSPVDDVSRPFAYLAAHLIALRRAARLPQRALAQAASISRGAVQRAESGTAAPSPAVLNAYLRACYARPRDRDLAHLLRARGRAAQRGRLRHLDAPDPNLIHTADDLGAALAAAYERAGAPSLSDPRLTPGRTPLPRTTAWRIVKRRQLPPTTEHLVTFLTICGIRPAHQRPYLAAYHRIANNPHTRPSPPHPHPGARPTRPAAMPLTHSLSPGEIETAVHDLLGLAARDARRNGTSIPRLDDLEADLYAVTDDDRLLTIQVKDYRLGSHLALARATRAAFTTITPANPAGPNRNPGSGPRRPAAVTEPQGRQQAPAKQTPSL
ncbi:helix-turn-helix domain-containing protein [Streptomyces xanthochromogenes]|uniref:helix-turn-helix domain-containing protein n=1 Tax=Streptomyces xanthochromogenes TaxID=67384 RepID=UPI003816C216